MTEFADLLQEEFAEPILFLRRQRVCREVCHAWDKSVVSSVDCTTKGVVKESWWPFSTTARPMITGNIVALGEQQFLDCDASSSIGILDNVFFAVTNKK